MSHPQQTKSARQTLILDLIQKQDIRSHEELVQVLSQKGIEVAQATLSRDLLEIGVVKKSGVYWVPTSTDGPAGSWASIFKSRGQSAKKAGPYLIVLKVEPGAAQLVAAEIERQSWSEVVGTVAGDDTIFVATDSPKDSKRLLDRFDQCLNQNKS